ncbi:MAG: putative phosphohistidine phosphatase, SixA [Chitinophagaceae bacterium]|nr:putative phosphohistidine phosphatase, SixA [Chitinophagaceae bacterium]
MKTLLLIRHAKSSWDDFTLSDFERPLNERGKTDAPKMGKRLRKKNVKIDAFISSPAKRAKKTAEYFIKEFGGDAEDIILVSALYDAGTNNFSETIKEIDDKYKSAAIFSHNPGITGFANQLIDKANIDNMPTCSVFAVKAEVEKWKDFSKAKKEFLFFDYPKKEE